MRSLWPADCETTDRVATHSETTVSPHCTTLADKTGVQVTTHEAFLGVTCDHLYESCPGLRRSVKANTVKGYPRYEWIGKQAIGLVDPLGTDICGWCVRKWRGSHAS